jgi:hypothetical protein
MPDPTQGSQQQGTSVLPDPTQGSQDMAPSSVLPDPTQGPQETAQTSAFADPTPYPTPEAMPDPTQGSQATAPSSAFPDPTPDADPTQGTQEMVPNSEFPSPVPAGQPVDSTIQTDGASASDASSPAAITGAPVVANKPALKWQNGQCDAMPNPQALNFSAFCQTPDTKPGDCWPAMYILGVQKAATTSLADSLQGCGLAAYGLPTVNTVHFNEGVCMHLGMPCKETLHPPLDLTTDLGKSQFTGLFSLNSCGKGVVHSAYGPSGESLKPCQQAQFVSATPGAGVADGTLFQAIPLSLRVQARFVVILREPVSRMLSWYNHVLADTNFKNNQIKAGYNLSSFEGYVHDQWEKAEKPISESSALTAIARGFYTRILHQFNGKLHGIDRKQLLVLNFDSLIKNATAGLRQVTTHFGLPILTRFTALPDKNLRDTNDKVVSIKCSTRDFAHNRYSGDLDQLYKRLHSDFFSHYCPDIEPFFESFDVTKSVHCSPLREITFLEAAKDPMLVDRLEERISVMALADDEEDEAVGFF